MRQTRSQIGVLAILSVFLFSCAAKKSPERLTIIAPDDFSGSMKLTACVSQAPADNIFIDASGNGSTSVCSASRDLKIVVKRGKLLTEVPARVSKTGDDFVVAISAEVAKPASPNK